MFTNKISTIFLAMLMIAAALMTVSFANRTASHPVADRSYDTVEQQRANPQISLLAADHGYDLVENLRSTSRKGVDLSYSQVEQLRIARVINVQADRSYDQAEQIRIEHVLNASVDPSYDLVEALRLERVSQ